MTDYNKLNTDPLPEGNAKTHILLVEDDSAHRLLCQRSLQSSGFDYSVETAATGQEALERLRDSEKPYDLILLDHGLPDCTGLDILDQIQTLSPHSPVVMITGYDNEEFAVMSLRAGASDYLPKTADLSYPKMYPI